MEQGEVLALNRRSERLEARHESSGYSIAIDAAPVAFLESLPFWFSFLVDGVVNSGLDDELSQRHLAQRAQVGQTALGFVLVWRFLRTCCV